MTIGQMIRKLRTEKCLTQKALSDQTGIPIRTLINYENSNREPNAKNMAILESFFHVSGEYLRGECDDRLPFSKWDDSDVMDAVRDNLSTLLCNLERAIRSCPDQEQKLSFDILVELRHILGLKDPQGRGASISLLQSVFSASTRFVDICINTNQDIEAERIEKARQATVEQYNSALDNVKNFFSK